MEQDITLETLSSCLEKQTIGEGSCPPALSAVLDRYPYFALAGSACLNAMYRTSRADFRQTAARTAWSLSSPVWMRMYLQGVWQPLAEPDMEKPEVEVAVEVLPAASPEVEMPSVPVVSAASPEASATPVVAPASPATDRAAWNAAVDAFIADCATLKPQNTGFVVDIASSIRPDEDLVTETLARVYASQHMYKKAIQVYHKLILRYPEKSNYFAVQIEMLKQELI
jgi:hypothetical protein